MSIGGSRAWGWCAMLAAVGAMVLPGWAIAQSNATFDPVRPFARITTAREWRDTFVRRTAMDPNDPFRNMSPGEWWPSSGRGQWLDAVEKGMTFEQFVRTLQGKANDGRTMDLRSPYPYGTAEEHWNAWVKAANGGTRHTRATLPDWSGDWTGGVSWDSALVRDYWAAVSDAYKPRYEQLLQAELESRGWWLANLCLPNGFAQSGWTFRFVHVEPTMVTLTFTDPRPQSRFIFTDGRGFLAEDAAFPQWRGESQGIWDGDQLIVWTKNIMANAPGQAVPEYSAELQLIERYARFGNELLVDVTWYDPLAFAFPWHTVGILTNDPNGWKARPPTINDCVSGNNVYYNALGAIAEFGPRDPQWRNQADDTPWLTLFKRAEEAKAKGLLPAAPSFMNFPGSGAR